MSQIAVQPIVLKDVRLIIGTDNYEKHISKAVLTPNTSIEKKTWQGGTPTATFTDVANPITDWSLDLDYAQDWDTTNSLCNYLLTNAGQQKAAKLQPKAGAAGKTFSVTVTILPGPIGGPIGDVQTGTVSLPVTGQPTPASDGTV